MSEQLHCPQTGQACNYVSVCRARQARVTEGWTLLPADFARDHPEYAELMHPVTEIADTQFCAEQSIQELEALARDGGHSEVRTQALVLASLLIQVRSEKTSWDRPPFLPD